MARRMVEFVGGPLDGHEHPFSHSTEMLASLVDLPISSNLLRVLNGEDDCPIGPASSIAIYELDRSGDELRYCHLCSIPNDEHQYEQA